MEEIQRKELSLRFPKQFLKKRILNADIPDIYGFHQSELDQVIQKNINSLF